MKLKELIDKLSYGTHYKLIGAKTGKHLEDNYLPDFSCDKLHTKKLTNADKIRQMTDEELAAWFAPHMKCSLCQNMNKPSGCSPKECRKYALQWLKQEVKDDDERKQNPADDG